MPDATRCAVVVAPGRAANSYDLTVTDPRDKQNQRDRYQRQGRHQRSREDERQLADARRARRQQRRPRRGGAVDDDGAGDEPHQRMRRRERVLSRATRTAPVVPNAAQHDALVVWLSRGRARVLGPHGERDATLAPDLAATQQTSIAVGDRVVVHERDGGQAFVVAVAERSSELVRSDPGNDQRRRVLAANVDVVVLVLTANRPRIGLIDRLQLALEGSGARLAVCINKCDLEHDRAGLEFALRPHRELAVPIAVVSAVRGDHIEELQALVRGRAVAFVGHSGVGKSTLLNCLDPEHARATAAVRAGDGKGRHTTTASSLRVLADGTRLIDTPGVRAFALPEGKDDAIAAFADVLAFADGCRFRDCAHVHEPGCAVRAAAESGALDAARYRAFLRLTRG